MNKRHPHISTIPSPAEQLILDHLTRNPNQLIYVWELAAVADVTDQAAVSHVYALRHYKNHPEIQSRKGPGGGYYIGTLTSVPTMARIGG